MTIPRETPSHYYDHAVHLTELGTQVYFPRFTMAYVHHLAAQVNGRPVRGQGITGRIKTV